MSNVYPLAKKVKAAATQVGGDSDVLDDVTAGTAAASKAVILDSNKSVSGMLAQGADISGLLSAQAPAADTKGASSTSEVAFDTTYTLPANTLAVGDVLNIRALVVVDDQDSNPTLTVRLKLNGQLVILSAIASAADEDNVLMEADVIVNAATTGVAQVRTSGIVAGSPVTVAGSVPLTGLNAAAAQIVSVTAQFDGSHADNQATLTSLIVRRN